VTSREQQQQQPQQPQRAWQAGRKRIVADTRSQSAHVGLLELTLRMALLLLLLLLACCLLLPPPAALSVVPPSAAHSSLRPDPPHTSRVQTSDWSRVGIRASARVRAQISLQQRSARAGTRDAALIRMAAMVDSRGWHLHWRRPSNQRQALACSEMPAELLPSLPLRSARPRSAAHPFTWLFGFSPACPAAPFPPPSPQRFP